MRKYEKPIVMKVESLSEGIYMASGEKASGAGSCIDCESRYMCGNRTKPKDWYQENDIMMDRGCEGCPYLYNPFGPHGSSLMPEWERRGYSPTDNYKYS